MRPLVTSLVEQVSAVENGENEGATPRAALTSRRAWCASRLISPISFFDGGVECEAKGVQVEDGALQEQGQTVRASSSSEGRDSSSTEVRSHAQGRHHPRA